jgi:hypothetical protein
MFIYLFWVWFVGFDESIVPTLVKAQSWQQGDTLYFPYMVDNFHVYRMPLAFISLILISLKNNFGKWGFLLFSISGPIMYFSDGWLYKVDLLENIEYAIQMLQGALIALCFFGKSSTEFCWNFNLYKSKSATE